MITRIQRVNIRYFPEPDAKAVTYTAMRKERKPKPNQQHNKRPDPAAMRQL